MKLLVITSCTGEKAVEARRQLVLEDFLKGAAHVKAREGELRVLMRPAGEMYTGQQHVRLMRGVKAFRAAAQASDVLELQILSAGYGWISEGRMVAPYECTFQGMRSAEVRRVVDQLGVPAGFRDVVTQSYDLGMILLGESYLEACRLDNGIRFGGPTLLFSSMSMARRLPQMQNGRVVPLATSDTARFSAGLVALKGELARRILQMIAGDRAKVSVLIEAGTDILDVLNDLEESVSRRARVAPILLSGDPRQLELEVGKL